MNMAKLADGHPYDKDYKTKIRKSQIMRIFITGGSKGIGKAAALHLTAGGHKVAICGSKDFDALENTAKEADKIRKGSLLPLFGDVSDYSQAALMFKKLTEHFGGIDVLINNAARAHAGFFADTPPNEWQKIIGINLGGVINCCHLAVNHMLTYNGTNGGQTNGHIINISSVWGNVGASCEAVYSATKGGVNAFTRALAKELGPSRIKVNAIACGVVDTDMNSFLSPEDKQELINQTALKRFAKPQEIAEAIEFLISSEYITGQIITLDGGMT
jgi:3-oxoacyl-[acyl-carrier protein] reductase